MIIADTSVWIDFLRHDSGIFQERLERGEIVVHTIVIGELASGNLRQRSETLRMLRRLPHAHEGSQDDCLHFLEAHRLYGRGLGWNDVQLLVSAHLSQIPIWSLDQPLADAARRLRVQWS